MLIIIIGILLIILYGIIKLIKYENGKTNWLAVTLCFLPFLLFFGFYFVVYLYGTS